VGLLWISQCRSVARTRAALVRHTSLPRPQSHFYFSDLSFTCSPANRPRPKHHRINYHHQHQQHHCRAHVEWTVDELSCVCNQLHLSSPHQHKTGSQLLLLFFSDMHH